MYLEGYEFFLVVIVNIALLVTQVFHSPDAVEPTATTGLASSLTMNPTNSSALLVSGKRLVMFILIDKKKSYITLKKFSFF